MMLAGDRGAVRDTDKLVEALERAIQNSEDSGWRVNAELFGEALAIARQLIEENEQLRLGVQARDAIIDHESASGPSGEIARLQARLSVAEAENEELRRAYESDEEAINQAAEVVRLRQENERLREENKRLFGETVSLEQGLENLNAELIIEQQDNERLKREVVDPAKTLGAGAYYRQDFVDDLQSRLTAAEAQRNEAEKHVGHWMGKAKQAEAVVEAAKDAVLHLPFAHPLRGAFRRYEEGR